MAAQRSIYAANDSSNRLPPYPTHPDWNGFDDFKPPAEDMIIDSYATTTVPLPKQSTFPVNSSYPPSQDRTPPLYPPLGQKQNSWEGQSDGYDGGGGDAVASDCYLNAPKEMQPEKRSFFQKASPDSRDARVFRLIRLCRFCRTLWLVGSTYSRCSLRQ